MKKIREITVFTYGDSSKISIWSNVPYFFTTTLEKKGIQVNRIDITPNKILRKYFNYIIYKVVNFIDKTNCYNYSRSLMFYLEAHFKIKHAVKQYPKSDAFIFLNFDFSTSRYTDKPSIQFGDWTYEHYINYFLNKKPNILERQFIKRQNSQINKSDIVFPLFPIMAEFMKEHYKSKIVYLGNVINSVYTASQNEILKTKRTSHKILFIGSPKYIEGAVALIDAFNQLKSKHPDLSLHFIGLIEHDFRLLSLPKDVFCYGYLDKGNNKDRDTYYNLLKEARVFVNTTPKWSAFSASIETMYFYTPVIVPSYDEFVKTFGTDFTAGVFCNDNVELSNVIESILIGENYEKQCVEAHNLVKDFTWDAYITKILSAIKKL
ncbi:MAG: glycosyltransferase involved in cell wall biosynthesis [Francisellaceae bacterium]|jgi:glycosyltransferase involved in cell wall biosynthesis